MYIRTYVYLFIYIVYIYAHVNVCIIFLHLCIYAVYELTNYTLLEKWTLKTVIIDTLWGGVLFALTTFIITMI